MMEKLFYLKIILTDVVFSTLIWYQNLKDVTKTKLTNIFPFNLTQKIMPESNFWHKTHSLYTHRMKDRYIIKKSKICMLNGQKIKKIKYAYLNLLF